MDALDGANTAAKPAHLREVATTPVSGYTMLMVGLGLLVLAGLGFLTGAGMSNGFVILISVLLGITGFILLIGLFTVAPNQAKVMQLFGNYTGTVRETGLRWANPLYTKKNVSLRVRNFESEKLKVNDHDGN